MFYEIALPETNLALPNVEIKGREVSFWDGATWQPDFCFQGGGYRGKKPKTYLRQVFVHGVGNGAHAMTPASFALA